MAAAELAHLIEPLARRFFGEPNRSLSSPTELRFGTRGSLKVVPAAGVWQDFETGEGGGVIDFVRRQTGVATPSEAATWLKDEGYLEGPPKHGREVCHYDYRDENGAVLFQVVRYEKPKDFKQRVPDPNEPKGYRWTVKGVRQVPYRLPDLKAAIAARQLVWIAEGEKDVDRLVREGACATTNAGGAGKWKAELSAYFTGAADVVVIADNDPQAKNGDGELLWHPDGRPRLPGQDHARAVARHLQPYATRIRLLDLGKHWQACPPKGDVSNWFEGGHTLEELIGLAAALPEWQPEPGLGGMGASVEPLGKPVSSKEGGQKAPHCDDDLARMFDATNFRYLMTTKDWRAFEGGLWIGDSELRLKSALRTFLTDEIKPLHKSAKIRNILGSNSKLNSVESELRHIRKTDDDLFDADDYLLRQIAHTSNLKDHTQHEHKREDYITKTCNATAEGDCPEWRKHIAIVTGNDEKFARYLQKLCGYALVGDRKEQMFAFLYGGGNNGKSVFVDTLAYVMGTYAVTVDAGTFMASGSVPRPKHELMPLRGARLVIASEVQPNAKWNVALIKQITGGEKVRADQKFQPSVEFNVHALLMMTGNDEPVLESVDVAFKRRIHLIPFLREIQGRKKDFGETLKAEADGILAWMTEGCRLWQCEGLDKPDQVRRFTDEYIAEQDLIQQWMDDCLDAAPYEIERAGKLFESWERYAKEIPAKPGDLRRFSARMKKHGYKTEHDRRGAFFIGLRIKPPLKKEEETSADK